MYAHLYAHMLACLRFQRQFFSKLSLAFKPAAFGKKLFVDVCCIILHMFLAVKPVGYQLHEEAKPDWQNVARFSWLYMST